VPSPAPTPTFNIIADDELATQYDNWMNTLAEVAKTDEADYRRYIRLAVLREKLGDSLGDEVPTTAEQARARHILVESEEEASQVIERLQAGEDFAELATELSLDTGSAAAGGDLGFVPRDRFVSTVDEVVFSLPLGQISEPVESQFGWHVIEVLERGERELSPADYSQAQRAALSEWIANAREAAEIQDLWSPEKAPPDPFLQGQF
jgi:parvulin-like peptidyl-prolyl isomerase